ATMARARSDSSARTVGTGSFAATAAAARTASAIAAPAAAIRKRVMGARYYFRNGVPGARSSPAKPRPRRRTPPAFRSALGTTPPPQRDARERDERGGQPAPCQLGREDLRPAGREEARHPDGRDLDHAPRQEVPLVRERTEEGDAAAARRHRVEDSVRSAGHEHDREDRRRGRAETAGEGRGEQRDQARED